MTINISTVARNGAGDFIVDLIDTGSIVANGYMQIRSGAKPASPQVAATGPLLATLNFANPAFAPFSNGSAYAVPIASDTNIPASGMASYFRVFNRNNVAVLDGDITLTGGGGDIQFDNINFIAGGVVAISSLLAIMPQ